MIDCNNLLHPFQFDTGTSQRQRVMPDLLSGDSKVDARNLADLLEYFIQLSGQVKYYDINQSVSDWQPFFKKSIPFTLASIIKYKTGSVRTRFEQYNNVFTRHYSVTGLQLLFQHIYLGIVQHLNNWSVDIQGSGLPIETGMGVLMRDTLRQPLRNFISLANTATNKFGIKRIDFESLRQNAGWELEITDIYGVRSLPGGNSRRRQMMALQEELNKCVPAFFKALKKVNELATKSLGRSFIPLQQELQKSHSPHLGLLFAFIRLFRYLQNDLNTYSKKHLDFFYRDVLRLMPREAEPDKAHIIFEIQKQLKSHLLEKGLLVKDGKDNNKAEMLFSLDDEIVVNKAQVADTKTLFFNNKHLYGKTYLEGAYIANDSRKADGIDKDFPGEDKNWPTLGDRYSKYADPETGIIKEYAPARIAFVLASPVLLLKEGVRTIKIQLGCKLNEVICEEKPAASTSISSCCNNSTASVAIPEDQDEVTRLFAANQLMANVKKMLSRKYCYISEQQILEAEKKGIDKSITTVIRRRFLTHKCFRPVCCSDDKKYLQEIFVRYAMWTKFLQLSVPNEADKKKLNKLFPVRRAFNITLSGQKEWIVPSEIKRIHLDPGVKADEFILNIDLKLEIDKPAVTFYNKDELKEDIGTKQPVVKIELDSKLGFIMNKDFRKQFKIKNDKTCCLLTPQYVCADKVSLYEFFRYVQVVNKIGEDPNQITDVTKIDVEVCGVKNLIVQNESLLDVNGPMMLFGFRPKVGSAFHIGSQEIFYKNWQEIWINIGWKDRPADFKVHYKFYNDQNEPYEDGSTEIINDSFKVRSAVLEKGAWLDDHTVNLFTNTMTTATFCHHGVLPFDQNVYHYQRSDFAGSTYLPKKTQDDLLPLNVNSLDSFLRMTLLGVSFQHDRFAYVLARHMMAVANIVDPISIDKARAAIVKASDLATAITNRILNTMPLLASLQGAITTLIDRLAHDEPPAGPPVNLALDGVVTLMTDLQAEMLAALNALPGFPNVALNHLQKAVLDGGAIIIRLGGITANSNSIINDINSLKVKIDFDADSDPTTINLALDGAIQLINGLIRQIEDIKGYLKVNEPLKIGLPSEPYTPISKLFDVDYTATAKIDDIDLIHIYPYVNTYKSEEIELKPSLFPVFCDEGTLFIGFENLVPGNNLHILFQLAEATADSEFEQEDVHWHYLDNNVWKSLRKGFEILNDGTNMLTVSGIIRFAMPGNMTTGNTIMPGKFHWIKASVIKNSKAVSENIGIHTQAIEVTFTNGAENDKLRLDQPLPAQSISKLQEADAAVKKVDQPYDSFGGRIPEIRKPYYTRVSELLRHKGKAIQKWDYEHITLEAFPQLYKAKCINHSLALNGTEYKNDFPVSPGYVLLAVIPDLNKLKAGRSFEPKAPVSLLKDVQEYLQQRVSPFVRLSVKNPRYEKVNFCIKVHLVRGKDENFYTQKLKDDLSEFLAPWAVGVYDKLSFGQIINRSDVIQFLENRDYIDFILDLKMRHEAEDSWPAVQPQSVLPRTPRSILFAGVIDVCIDKEECPKWDDKVPCIGERPFVEYCK